MDKELETLIRGMRRGEAQALGDFYHTYGRTIAAYLMRLHTNEEDIKDITQEILVRIWQMVNRRRITCSTVGEANSYVRRCAQNGVISLARKRKKESRDLSIDDPEHVVKITHKPTNDVDTEKLIESNQILASLKKDQRDVFILWEIEGFNYQEIAATLGFTEGQVRGILARARKNLKKYL